MNGIVYYGEQSGEKNIELMIDDLKIEFALCQTE